MFSLATIIDAAKEMGIALTNASLDSEMCKAWCDRVALAISARDRGDRKGWQAAIDEANRYAI